MVLEGVSEADDDLIESLLDLTESCLRLEHLREGEGDDGVVVKAKALLAPEPSMSLPVVIFRGFCLRTCSDPWSCWTCWCHRKLGPRVLLTGVQGPLAGHSVAFRPAY